MKVEKMLFRLGTARRWELPREMDVPITREQVASWLNGVHLRIAAPQLTEAQYEFVIQGALPDDDELMDVWHVMVRMRMASPSLHGPGS